VVRWSGLRRAGPESLFFRLDFAANADDEQPPVSMGGGFVLSPPFRWADSLALRSRNRAEHLGRLGDPRSTPTPEKKLDPFPSAPPGV